VCDLDGPTIHDTDGKLERKNRYTTNLSLVLYHAKWKILKGSAKPEKAANKSLPLHILLGDMDGGNPKYG
jgi:hypothetical protein